MSEIQAIPAIREFATHDCLESITQLVHATYASQAARGLQYWGTHQTVEETAKRYASGHGLVAAL